MRKLLAFLTFKCSHEFTTWPRKRENKTVVVCTQCGCEIVFDETRWERVSA